MMKSIKPEYLQNWNKMNTALCLQLIISNKKFTNKWSLNATDQFTKAILAFLKTISYFLSVALI